MMAARTDRIELVGYVALALGLGLIQFHISAEIFLDVAALIWIYLAVRDSRRPDVPAFFIPLLALAAWTLISCAMSADPAYSLLRSRQLLLFLLVPGVMRLARGERAGRILDVAISFGAVAALIGVIEYFVLGFDEINKRPRGLLDHYMTYSGVLMLIVCAAIARLLYREKEWLWPAIAVPALVVALALTQSRNAWIGTVLAAAVLFAIRDRRLLLVLPVVAIIGAVVAPESVKHRALSVFDMHDPANQDRRAMLVAGAHMITDHPLFGVGMNMVPRVYLQYRTADAYDSADAKGPETRSHLHNVPVQLAAERGLPALAAWLWFIVVAGRDLYRQVRRGPARATAAAGLAALIAMVGAGLFEHNFGDSEPLILFLGMIALPFAAARRADGTRIAPINE